MLNLLSISTVATNMVSALSKLGIWYLVLFNAFGVMATILRVIEFQMKKRIFSIIFAMSSVSCWVVYFLLQGDFVTALTNGVCVFQAIVFMQREKHSFANSKIWLFIFIAFQIAIGIIFWQTWKNIFPLIGSMLEVTAYFIISRKAYRLLGVVFALFFVLNSAFNLYYVSLINDVAVCISSLIAIIRYDRKDYKETFKKLLSNRKNIQV